MEIKLIRYWKVELFEYPKSGIVQMLAEGRKPFFTGYAKDRINPDKLHGSEFISLATQSDFMAFQSVRLYRVDEIKCTPVYEVEEEAKADSDAAKKGYNRASFENAAKPLIKWLSENANPHVSVIVDSTHAELLTGEISISTEVFLKD